VVWTPPPALLDLPSGIRAHQFNHAPVFRLTWMLPKRLEKFVPAPFRVVLVVFQSIFIVCSLDSLSRLDHNIIGSHKKPTLLFLSFVFVIFFVFPREFTFVMRYSRRFRAPSFSKWSQLFSQPSPHCPARKGELPSPFFCQLEGERSSSPGKKGTFSCEMCL